MKTQDAVQSRIISQGENYGMSDVDCQALVRSGDARLLTPGVYQTTTRNGDGVVKAANPRKIYPVIEKPTGKSAEHESNGSESYELDKNTPFGD